MERISLDEFKEMKDSISKLKDNLEEVTARCTEEIRGLKDEITQIKKENEILRDNLDNLHNKEKETEQGEGSQSEVGALADRMTQIDEKVDKISQDLQEVTTTVKDEKEKVDKISQDVEEVTTTLNDEKEKTEKISQELQEVTTTVKDDKEKVDKISQELQEVTTTVKDDKEKYNREVKVLQESSAKVTQDLLKFDWLQRVLKCLHFTLQTRKELGEEVLQLETEVITVKNLDQQGDQQNSESGSQKGNLLLAIHAPVPLCGEHPSRQAMPSNAAHERRQILKEIKERSQFSVYLHFLEWDRCVDGNYTVWIGGYTNLQPSDFMDPVTGVYTIPAQGKYQFTVDKDIATGIDFYLCTDKVDKREKISYEERKGSNTYKRDSLTWNCDINDKVWVEAVGKYSTNNDINGLRFYGKMEYS